MMADIEKQPKIRDDQDNSPEALKARLSELQPLLGDVMLKADELFDDVFALAPHPKDVPKGFPVTAVSSINAEPSRELTIRLDGNRCVCIHRHPMSATPTYPLKRVWLLRPDEVVGLRRQVEVLKLAGRREHEGIPYDVETSRFDTSTQRCNDFIGFGYKDQEPSIDEVLVALAEADEVAKEALGITTSGRLQTQRSIIASETFWGSGIGSPYYHSRIEP